MTEEELQESLRQATEELTHLREVIRQAGGWLQPDGSYRWAYYLGDDKAPPHFRLLEVNDWIARRRQDAKLLDTIRCLVPVVIEHFDNVVPQELRERLAKLWEKPG